MNIFFTHHPVKFSRIFFLWTSTVFFFSLGTARQQDAIYLRPATASPIEVKPGETIAAAFKLINNTDKKQFYDALIILPKGWKLVVREMPFELEPFTTDIRLISFSVPTDAPAKTYQIRYTVKDHNVPVNEASVTIDVDVVEIIQLELKRLQAPRFAIAGSTFKSIFLITNMGNTVIPVSLNLKSSLGFPIRTDSTIINLAPKESREISLSVITEPIKEKITHNLEIEAMTLIDLSKKVKANSMVDIIPRITQIETEYFELPITAKLRGVGEQNLFGVQAEITGYGSTNEQKTDRLEFLIRTPQTHTKSILGQRDEYRASYRTKNYELIAGDMNYSLSPLTELGRYSTGIGGRAYLKTFTIGGFYNNSRWPGIDQKELAGFISYEFKKDNTIGLNFLNKSEQYSSNIGSLLGILTPLPRNELELELAASSKEGKQGSAISTKFSGAYKWFNYDLHYVYSAPDFGGYYSDINFFSAGINTQLSQKIRVQTYIRQEKRNLSLDTNFITAPSDAFFQIGANYSDNFAVNYRRQIQKDRFDSSRFNRYEDVLQTILRYNFSNVNLSLNIDFGSTHDEILNRISPSKRYALYAGIKPTNWSNLSGSIEFSNNQNIYTGEDQKHISGSINAYIQIASTTQMQVNFFRSKFDIFTSQIYTVADATLDHIFSSNNHKLTLRGRYNAFAPEIVDNSFAYALEYAVPFNAPLKRITGIGQLRGVLKDEKGKGIANVLISAGTNFALTDNQGSFYFPSLKPGTIYIIVDQAGIGLENITTQPMPMEIIIRGGEESKVTITTTRSVTIAGNSVLYSMKEYSLGDTTTTFIKLGGKAGVIMEISNGTEIFRRVTDNQGKFLFNDLRPGRWVITVAGGEIPDYYFIQPDSVIVELKAGEKKDTTFQIRQRKRTIKMLHEGIVVQEVKQETPKPASMIKPCVINFNEKRKGFVIQVSSWATSQKARQDAKRIEKLTKMKSFIEVENIPNIGRRFRVYLGEFKTKEEAEIICRKIPLE